MKLERKICYIFSCNEYQSFWLSWGGHETKFGYGDRPGYMQLAYHHNDYSSNFLGFKTAIFQTAHIVFDPGKRLNARDKQQNWRCTVIEIIFPSIRYIVKRVVCLYSRASGEKI